MHMQDSVSITREMHMLRWVFAKQLMEGQGWLLGAALLQQPLLIAVQLVILGRATVFRSIWA